MSAVPEKTPRRQQQRSIKTKQKLLDAALEAFSENGFKGTSTRDIAERAGVHHPLITYHFRNKDQLWRSAAKYVFNDFMAAISAAREEYEDDCPKKRMASMIGVYVRYAARHPALHKIILQESSHPSQRLDWLVEHYLQPLSATGADVVSELQGKGVIAAGDPALIYNMIRVSSGGLIALALELKASSGIDLSTEDRLDELADLITRIFLPGALPDAAAPQR